MAFRKILWQQKQQRERRAESSFEFSVLVFGSSRLSDKRIKGSRVSLRFAWRYTKCDKSIFFAVVFLCSQFILMMCVCGPTDEFGRRFVFGLVFFLFFQDSLCRSLLMTSKRFPVSKYENGSMLVFGLFTRSRPRMLEGTQDSPMEPWLRLTTSRLLEHVLGN